MPRPQKYNREETSLVHEKGFSFVKKSPLTKEAFLQHRGLNEEEDPAKCHNEYALYRRRLTKHNDNERKKARLGKEAVNQASGVRVKDGRRRKVVGKEEERRSKFDAEERRLFKIEDARQRKYDEKYRRDR